MAAIPAKADPLVQHEFLTQKLEPKLDEAEAGKRAVFFVDASHFVLAPFLGIVWCFTRLFIKGAANKGEAGCQMVSWRQSLEQNWVELRFGEVKVETKGKQHVFEVQVYLNDLDPKAVRVEIYADGVHGGSPVRHEMKLSRQLVGAVRGYVYSVTVSAARPATDYTARLIPNYDSVAVPLEAAQILWQK